MVCDWRCTVNQPHPPKSIDWLQVARQGLEYGRRSVALSQFALRSAGELTDLVAEMHHTIAQAPWPRQRFVADAKAAPFPYRIVSGSFRQTAAVLAAIPRSAEVHGESTAWRRFRAIANGVSGDKAARWNNAIGHTLGFYRLDGSPVSVAELSRNLAAERTPKLIIFAHGLCHSELEWDRQHHRQFVESASTLGYQSIYLRYNSGRAIYENGAELAELLEQCFATLTVKLTLIGHSMGGLLFRSAFVSAEKCQHRWLAQVENCACIGSPHQGAPMERLGNLANALLSYTPYTAPLMRLGNIRSRGIKDLRHGCITEADSQSQADHVHGDTRAAMPALPPQIRHLFIAASVEQAATAGDWLGDGLVPISSALGQHEDVARQLEAPQLRREHIHPLGHLALLSDRRVYHILRDWLGWAAA